MYNKFQPDTIKPTSASISYKNIGTVSVYPSIITDPSNIVLLYETRSDNGLIVSDLNVIPVELVEQ